MPPEPLLEIRDLNAWIGTAHILQGVDLQLGDGAACIIGRNGMGKSTLCNAVMGLVGSEPKGRVTGSIRFAGQEILGRAVHRVAAGGIAYVPQGRRIYRSLTTHEHLSMVRPRKGAWTVERAYDLFPRLAERKRVRAGRLSGGEQQMLAIVRALMTDPALVIMDEPSEGLAPKVVDELCGACRRLIEDGLAVLVAEQSLVCATTLARRQLVMVRGRVAEETTSRALLADPVAQQRWLGITPMAAEPAAPPHGPRIAATGRADS